MSVSQSEASALLNGINFQDPRMQALLQAFADKLYALDNQINPPTVVSSVLGTSGVQLAATPDVTSFALTLFANNIRLNWTSVGTAFYLYEIRLGTTWATAAKILTTANLSADINPLSIPALIGTYTFQIKSIDAFGQYSVNPAIVVLTVPILGTPVVSATVIGNNVLLKWTTPTSVFTIDHYEVQKNGAVVGNSTATFDVLFETTAGVFNYSIVAVDFLGNRSLASPALALTLQAPSDYLQQAILGSTFTGTKLNTFAYTDVTIT